MLNFSVSDRLRAAPEAMTTALPPSLPTTQGTAMPAGFLVANTPPPLNTRHGAADQPRPDPVLSQHRYLVPQTARGRLGLAMATAATLVMVGAVVGCLTPLGVLGGCWMGVVGGVVPLGIVAWLNKGPARHEVLPAQCPISTPMVDVSAPLTKESLHIWANQAGITQEEKQGRAAAKEIILSAAQSNAHNALIIRGALNLSYRCLSQLPEGLTVGGTLYLNGCIGLTHLPEGLTVGGTLYLITAASG